MKKLNFGGICKVNVKLAFQPIAGPRDRSLSWETQLFSCAVFFPYEEQCNEKDVDNAL